MGFGTLFFGYFVLFGFSLAKTYFFADIIGALIAIYAFSKLAQYNRYFVAAMASSLVLMLFCGVNAASLLLKLYPPDGTVDLIVDLCKLVAACVMHIFLFLGTRGICLGAEAAKLREKTERNLIATMIYYASALVVLACGTILGEMAQYLSMVVYLYWIVCMVLNLSLIYRCFGILCPADEDEDAPKRSRFAIINKINDKFDAIEASKDAYRRESMRLALEEAEKRAKEKEKRHPHKKKKKK